MSCIHFSAAALGNIVRVAVKANPLEPEKTLHTVSQELALIAKANAMACKQRYPSKEFAPVTLEAILKDALAPNKAPQLEDACKIATMLRYNCEEDTDCLKEVEGAVDALSCVLVELLLAQQAALATAQKQVEAYSPGP